MPTTVFIADAQFLTKNGMISVIKEIPEFDIIFDSAELDKIQLNLEQKPADIAMIDASTDEAQIFTQIASIKKKSKQKFLLLVNEKNKVFINEIIELGIKGIITKKCSKNEVINAIQSVANNERFYCNKILDIMLDKQSRNKTSTLQVLSPRELEVLKLIASGSTSNSIAKKLFVSVHTINSHRKSILKKLDMKSPTELIVYAIQNDIVNTQI